MSNLCNFIKKIKNQNYKFINNTFKEKIINCINNFLPILNKNDNEIIVQLTFYIIDVISYKYNFKSNEDYYHQWIQNNYKDLKGVILLLLPFIDDKEKENGYLLDKLTDLNQLLYTFQDKYISKNILSDERTNILDKYFKFGNMSIGLLENESIILKLYDDNDEKLIYKIIYHNLLGLLLTLEIMNGKYYINWINITPINIDNYKNSHIYKESINIINKNNITTILDNKLLDYYSGIWVGDIYNLFRIKFYEQIKKLKWLIFPYEISENNKIYLIQGLHKMININTILNNDIYDNLILEEQHIFIKAIEKIIFNFKNKISVVNYFDVDIEIVKYLLIYIVSNDNNIIINDNIIINKFKIDIEIDELINIEKDQLLNDFSQDNIKILKKIKLDDIISCLELILKDQINIIWNFLKKQLELFNKSVYGKYLITRFKKNDNKIYYQLNEFYKFKLLNKKEIDYINLKNIYNISKSLSHNNNNNNWILLDNNYLSLNKENKEIFFNKIFGITNDTEWFNLKENLKKQKINYDIKNYNYDIQNILYNFREIYLDIIFEELIISGILSEFNLNKNITDNELLPSNTIKKQIQRKKLLKDYFNKNQDEWLKSYYYLTNDTFSNLPKIRFDKNNEDIQNNNKYTEYSYFDLICKDQSWLTFYAMDWISQISFFQHYIFHQVLYVTGATGQGKSTQVPKLFLYALKVIDYKSNGKVICTAPRITPVTDNAKRIAEELGTPIEMLSNTSNFKIKTNNFYLQYKYSGDAHVKVVDHGFIKIVTDGTLLEEIKKNPTMFVQNDKVKNDKIVYVNETVYDILFIDEAHEHGSNMDIIITLARQTCYYNNKIKLIIVSATMDDDEPIYRRYFKNINDKLLFPIKSEFYDPILNQEILLNPEYMDRRYHISPPGETSQYRVEEIYLDNDFNKDNDENAKNAQETGYKKIIEICNSTVNGQILFFANGKNEIKKAVQYLNLNTPSTCIAIPYFAELNKNYKDMITKINITISKIRNKKENVHLEWDETFIEDNKVSTNIYKRAIIIATNVAEASVTIPDLYYVVDNGYAKVNNYVPQLNQSKLEVQKISEASRVQRKGRVGRIGDGFVYFMYKKNARKDIKPKYKITEEDISEKIINLLCTKNLNEININDFINYNKLIVSNVCDPNIFNNISYSHLNENQQKNIYTLESNLRSIYYINYRINDNYLKSNYYINNNDNKYLYEITDKNINKIINKFIYRHVSGQLLSNLLDEFGNFYLIHPFENYIKRNILNNIIYYEKKKINYIPFESYKFILSNLYNKNLLIDMNLNYLPNITYANIKKPNYFKTELCDKITKLYTDLNYNSKNKKINDAISLIAASAMNCENEVYEIKILLDIITSVSNIIKTDINWDQFKNLYQSDKYNSDIIFLYNIIKNLKKNFNNLLVFNMNTPSFHALINYHIEIIFNKFTKYIKSKLYNSILEPPNLNYDTELWNKLINIKNSTNNINILNDAYKKIIIKNEIIINILKNDIILNSIDIINWADNIYLNGEIIIKFLEELSIKNLDFILLSNDIKKSLLQKNEIIDWAKILYSNYYKHLTDYTIEEKIIRSFIYGYPLQFVYKISYTNILTMINNYSIYNIEIKKSSNESLIDFSNDYIFYLNYSDMKNEDESNENEDIENNKSKDLVEFNNNKINISILSVINIKWLIAALPLYINPLFSINNNIKSNNTMRFKKDIINSWNNNYNIYNTLELPLLHYFYKTITLKMNL